MKLNKLPTVDFDWIHDKINNCKKDLEDVLNVGTSYTYTTKGTSALFKRQFTIRHDPKNKQVAFEIAMGAAIRYGFIPEIQDWLLENRKYKSGGYVSSVE